MPKMFSAPFVWLCLPACLCQCPVLAGSEVGEGWAQATHCHLVAQQRLGDAVVRVATWESRNKAKQQQQQLQCGGRFFVLW
jgi:hypothetical protein